MRRCSPIYQCSSSPRVAVGRRRGCRKPQILISMERSSNTVRLGTPSVPFRWPRHGVAEFSIGRHRRVSRRTSFRVHFTVSGRARRCGVCYKVPVALLSPRRDLMSACHRLNKDLSAGSAIVVELTRPVWEHETDGGRVNSSFRLHFGEDGYPISRLLTHRAGALGFSRGDLGRRLGYRDIGKGHEVLGVALKTGTVPAHMRKHLADALQLDEAIIDAVMEATSRQRQDEARTRLLAQERHHAASFQPHLRTETARTVPEPIFIAAMIGTARLRHVELPPETWTVNADERTRLVAQAIRDHYREHKSVAAFGAILSYTLVTMSGYLVDFGFPFDTAGNPAGPCRTVRRLGEATLGLKCSDSRLSSLFQKIDIHSPL